MKPIVLVGHCRPDVFMLRSAIRRALPDAATGEANDDVAVAAAGGDALLLINRVLDGRFTGGDSGIALIARLAAAPDPPTMLLVSDRPDAQREAEAVGAEPGFGKTELHDASTIERLRAAAGA